MKSFALVLAFVVGVSCDGAGHHHAGAGGLHRNGRQEAPPPLSAYGAAASDAQATYSDLDGAASDAGADPLSMLQTSIPGIPGEDYPIYAEAPETAFTCDGQVDGGYYADPEAECQVFHICTADGQGGLSKYSFLCPNGTIFNQNYFICDWWFNFDCAEAEGLYSLNNDIAAERAALDASASDAQSSYAAPVEAAASADAPADYAAPAEYAAADREGRQLQGGRRGGVRRQG